MKTPQKAGSTTTDAGTPAVHCAHDEMVDVVDLIPNPRNPNKHSDKQVALLAKIIRHQGWRAPIVVSKRSGFVVAGHGRLDAAKLMGVQLVPVNRQEFATEADEWAHLIADNRIAELADMDNSALGDLLKELDGLDFDLEAAGFDEKAADLLTATESDVDAEPQVDKAAELQKKWNTATGQLWQLGDHRLICGDCTDAKTVARVMGGEKSALVCADPPYGMGKENEGIANDNLYADKLDKFQMAWWRAARTHLADNASAYIWGNAEDLWRLWYRGGLAESERLTFRNEIVWDKGGGGFGVGVEALRCYFPEERCLFFMLGEQGFNNNADNYWEGWEPIRNWLEFEISKVGGVEFFKSVFCDVYDDPRGVFGHKFTKSQWQFITREQYQRLQSAANGTAFKRDYDDLQREHDELKREHDELKREFYATRAYFDNTHDNMTDVWDFPRVTGEDRHGHATPKPVDMIARCVKSSSPAAGIVFDGFSGSGTTLIACERLGRKCRAVEISPDYVAVALQRWADATGKTPELLA
jgi:DNA modification methylase